MDIGDEEEEDEDEIDEKYLNFEGEEEGKEKVDEEDEEVFFLRIGLFSTLKKVEVGKKRKTQYLLDKKLKKKLRLERSLIFFRMGFFW